MKTIRPIALGLLPRNYRERGREKMAVAALACFDFGSNVLKSEPSLWRMAAKQLGPTGILDEGMPKPNGEVLLAASAYPPPGFQGCGVKVSIGTINKELRVLGDRTWTLTGPTEPAPFESIPIRWENAFGGPGFEANPIGRGVGQRRLPNIEDPAKPIRSESDRPRPAGFLPIDCMWPPRVGKTGTYKGRTKEDDPADLPSDFDVSYWNCAPSDQRINGYFRGDEHFLLSGMHPKKRVQEARLPGVRPRVFIMRYGSEALEEIETRLETLWFFPDEERAALLFRGTVDVTEDDRSDIRYLIGGLEDIALPRTKEHYEQVLRKRTDEKKGALYALMEAELLPTKAACESITTAEEMQEAGEEKESRLARNQQRRGEEAVARARQTLIDKGMDPKPLDEAVAKSKKERNGDVATQIERIEAEAENAKEAAKAKRPEEAVREAAQRAGLEHDVVAKAQSGAAGPPTFRAKAELARLRDLATLSANAGAIAHGSELVDDPELEHKLLLLEKESFQSYRRYTHFRPPAPALTAGRRKELRDEVLAARASGTSLKGADYTRADLSGLDLSGLDFEAALLEGADLSRANLSNARLENATLARANLSNANLHGANLRFCNLGNADLTGAQLDGAQVEHATFWQTILKDASLTGVTYSTRSFELPAFGDQEAVGSPGSGFWETVLTGATLERIAAPGATFLDLDMTEVRFAGADLRRAVFVRCKLAGASFDDANLEQATFVGVQGAKASFRRAKLRNARFVDQCDLAQASFTGAALLGANLRGTNLTAADLTDAKLEGSDLSGGTLHGTILRRANLKGALLIKADCTGASFMSANLTQALLQKAILAGADLRGANLFRADLAHVRGNDATNLKDAHVDQARFLRRNP